MDFEDFVILAIVSIATTLLLSWATMLLWGMLHDYWSAVPAFSYGASVVIYVLASLLTSRTNMDRN